MTLKEKLTKWYESVDDDHFVSLIYFGPNHEVRASTAAFCLKYVAYPLMRFFHKNLNVEAFGNFFGITLTFWVVYSIIYSFRKD